MQHIRLWQMAGAAVCVVVLSVVVYQVRSARSEVRLQSLLQPRAISEPPPPDPQKLAARNQRARQLYGIWMARDKRNVADEILPYLQDDDDYLRNSAVRMLARLENPSAETKLQAMVAEMQEQRGKSTRFIPLETLKLALARIRSRHLSGRARVEAIANGIGLSFDEIVRLSQHVNHPVKGRYSYYTPAYDIVGDMVNVLYVMGKQGEDIRPLTSRLTLNRAQQVKLQAASLPIEQEISLILDYLSHIAIEANGDYDLRNHLMGLGPLAADMVIQRLTEMRSHRDKYPQRIGFVFLFRASACVNDRRVLPLLEQFETDHNQWIRMYAGQSRRAIEQESWPPPLP